MIRALMVIFMIAVFAGDARADDSWKPARGLAVSYKIFPNSPCVDKTQMRFSVPLPDRATEGSAWVYPGNCVIYFHDALRDLPWSMFCKLTIHEQGHLAGLGHSDNPRSVMYPFLMFAFSVDGPRMLAVDGSDRRCYDRGRAYVGLPYGGYGWWEKR